MGVSGGSDRHQDVRANAHVDPVPLRPPSFSPTCECAQEAPPRWQGPGASVPGRRLQAAGSEEASHWPMAAPLHRCADERLEGRLCRLPSSSASSLFNAVSLRLRLIGPAAQLALAVSTCNSPNHFKTRQLGIIRAGRRGGAAGAGVNFCQSVSGVKQCRNAGRLAA